MGTSPRPDDPYRVMLARLLKDHSIAEVRTMVHQRKLIAMLDRIEARRTRTGKGQAVATQAVVCGGS